MKLTQVAATAAVTIAFTALATTPAHAIGNRTESCGASGKVIVSSSSTGAVTTRVSGSGNCEPYGAAATYVVPTTGARYTTGWSYSSSQAVAKPGYTTVGGLHNTSYGKQWTT
ncbi:hypothetical protein P5G50_17115 [Leifsonia sp. F6_8S_P_1B]|uniref:Uncharacterized protein n=1 Tax=Leifsonia williamsii TaxID=3035919 RepID=A0ABT8KHD4_9MICO|nr:hypothetical protein [Leifsonia williamsii]MDN4616171.1 hypothetical protein [Leifsonia williamsii]